MAKGKNGNRRDRAKPVTWAVKCRSCKQYSRYSEYYQKPKMHSGKVVSQSVNARCPKCGNVNQYRSADLELISIDMLEGLTRNQQVQKKKPSQGKPGGSAEM